jgi:hypothetical protein
MVIEGSVGATVTRMSSRGSANSSLHSPDLRVLTVNGMDKYWKEIEPYISKLDKIKMFLSALKTFCHPFCVTDVKVTSSHKIHGRR